LANCPTFKRGAAPIDISKEMPRLAEFNIVCVNCGLEPIKWR